MSLDPIVLDIILIVIAIEFFILVFWLYLRDALRLVPACACFLASGALLVVALRFGVDGPIDSPIVLACLTLSFPAHIATLWLVWYQAR